MLREYDIYNHNLNLQSNTIMLDHEYIFEHLNIFHYLNIFSRNRINFESSNSFCISR